MAEGLSESTKRGLDAARRYRDLWKAAILSAEGPIRTEVVESHVEGSLRPETTRLSASIGETVISITNSQAAFGNDSEIVTEKLAALEELVAA